jgi:hypothetical protein
MPDWLGAPTSPYHRKTHRPFKEARAFARGLGFKSEDAWRAYSRSGQKPDDIPANPLSKYAKAGWTGWGDWLGTGRVPTHLRQYRSFKDARAFVHGRGLTSYKKWAEYFKSGRKPADIPAYPDKVYREDGWASWGDWLGSGAVAPGLRQYRSFKDARAFVRGLGLTAFIQWVEYCASGKKPDDIPSNPSLNYAKAGWAGFGDWLGTGRTRVPVIGRSSFKDARSYARRLNLKSSTEWFEYARSGKKPANVPASPQQVYAIDGWSGWGDWLGYVR